MCFEDAEHWTKFQAGISFSNEIVVHFLRVQEIPSSPMKECYSSVLMIDLKKSTGRLSRCQDVFLRISSISASFID